MWIFIATDWNWSNFSDGAKDGKGSFNEVLSSLSRNCDEIALVQMHLHDRQPSKDFQTWAITPIREYKTARGQVINVTDLPSGRISRSTSNPESIAKAQAESGRLKALLLKDLLKPSSGNAP